MTNNAQKTPYARAINQFAEQKVLDAIQTLGKALPCHVVAIAGSIVTVQFDITNTPFTLPNVTCPMFGPEYIRYPTQVGDLGVVISADCYIGGVSGLGGGVADLSLQSNLSTLIFFPIANANWSTTDNADALVLYGPDGVIIRPTDKSNILTVDTTNVRTSGVLQAGNGATGTFTHVTVSHGIVTSGS